ncbi:DUF481 domain-containing protein [bacterium]|nr:DUF481 domain-containing protein [bacterium]
MNRRNYLVPAVILCMIPLILGAKTIINTDKLMKSIRAGSLGAVEIDADVEQGNSRLVDIDAASVFGLSKGAQNLYLFAGLDYLSEEEEDLILRNFLHLRHQYHWGPRWRSFTFYQLQRNNTLLLRRRQLAGTGLRIEFAVFDSVRIDIGTGFMWEQEILNPAKLETGEDPDKTVWRMANVMTLSCRYGPRMSVLNTLYFQPDFSHFRDFRFLNETGFLFSVNRTLSLNVSLIARYDSCPPARLKKTDVQMQSGIMIHL